MKRRNDIILILVLLAGIVSLFIYVFLRDNSGDAPYVNIFYEDKVLKSVPLEKNDRIVVKGDISEMVIIIKNGRVHVEESGCEGQNCVREGEISYFFQWICCAPNKIYIRIGRKVNVDS